MLSRCPIEESDREVLDGDGRTVLFAAVAHRWAVSPFFTTRLSSPPDRSALRCSQVVLVSRFIAGYAGAGLPPVLTGGLSADPDSDELR